MCELGLAGTPDEETHGALQSMLSRLYGAAVSATDTGRSRSTAEVEFNRPASALSRASLGWKSLLFALPQLPDLRAASAPRDGTMLLEHQGLALFRRDNGRVLVSLDYGHHGGGHGHPDRLNFGLHEGERHWLQDVGTGSYVDRSLFWYRSGLAHNAPMVNWRTQPQSHGSLLEHSARRARAAFGDAAAATQLQRELAVEEGYAVDVLSWSAAAPASIVLPLHLPSAVLDAGAAPEFVPVEPLPWDRASCDAGLEFASLPTRTPLPKSTVRLTASEGGETLHTHVLAPQGHLWRMTAPGAPGSGEREFLVVESTRAATGRVILVHDWSASVAGVEADSTAVTVLLRTGAADVHRISGAPGGPAMRQVEPVAASSIPASPEHMIPFVGASVAVAALRFPLGEPNYRRSELDWEQHGRPGADVSMYCDHTALTIEVDVRKVPLNVAASRAEPYLDNENPDINSDGIQLHLMRPWVPGDDNAQAAWLLVPEPGGRVRVTARNEELRAALRDAQWVATQTGYRVTARVRRAAFDRDVGRPWRMDVVVNLLAEGRERRSGQLVLSGAAGEWIYLAGDRQPHDRMPWFRLAPEK
jgi:hypothetical protein